MKQGWEKIHALAKSALFQTFCCRSCRCRTLIKQPALILADEPTGQLDTLTGASIIKLLRQVVAQTGVTIVVASHDPNVHDAADLIFGLQDGRLVEREALTGEDLFKPPERRGVGPCANMSETTQCPYWPRSVF